MADFYRTISPMASDVISWHSTRSAQHYDHTCSVYDVGMLGKVPCCICVMRPLEFARTRPILINHRYRSMHLSILVNQSYQVYHPYRVSGSWWEGIPPWRRNSPITTGNSPVPYHAPFAVCTMRHNGDTPPAHDASKPLAPPGKSWRLILHLE